MTSFDRGEHPVGVRTVELHDPARDRALTVEVWYPADGALAGADRDPAQRDRYLLLPGFPPSYQHAVRDAAPAPGRRPLIVFSHGLAGHRRQSTFYCTHLASHGYAVIAPDHAGNTFRDLMGGALKFYRYDTLPAEFLPKEPLLKSVWMGRLLAVILLFIGGGVLGTALDIYLKVHK